MLKNIIFFKHIRDTGYTFKPASNIYGKFSFTSFRFRYGDSINNGPWDQLIQRQDLT